MTKTFLALVALVLIATACNAATPTMQPTVPAHPIAPPTPQATLVPPTLPQLAPAQAAPGDQVRVIGKGGYLFTPPSAYNESARNFQIFFDGKSAGTISCYVNHCETKFTIPRDATPGAHEISVEGGSKLTFNVIAPKSTAMSWETLLAQAQAANAQRYEFAIKQGAQIVPTADGKSFYVLWLPKGFETTARRAIIVTLHGHASWAFDEMFLWHSFAAQRGYAILALQWWFGEGERFQDYYSPYEMYPTIERVLREQKIARGNAILHGFSRGSANSYAVAALDNSINQFFGLAIANAGGVGLDFPSNVDIERGKFGAQPFAGTQWLLFCGGNDPNPDRDGCGGMTKTRAWIEKYGGTIALFLQDPNGDHGAFHRNPTNVNTALDLFAKLQTAR